MKTAVAGAAGHFGRLVIEGRLETQPAENVIAIVRDEAKVADLARAAVQVRGAD